MKTYLFLAAVVLAAVAYVQSNRPSSVSGAPDRLPTVSELPPGWPFVLSPALQEYAQQNLSDGRPRCEKVSFCGELAEVSCRPEADGLISYFNVTTGAPLVTCSAGFLPQPHACPPKEWVACKGAAPK